MKTSTFTLSSEKELLSLHRAMMEARYCTKPYDSYISAAPRLARIHRKLIAIIRALDLPNELGSVAWDEWLVLDAKRREWHVALDRARKFSNWQKCNHLQKRDLASSYLAPFEVSSGLLDEFIVDVDGGTALDANSLIGKATRKES